MSKSQEQTVFEEAINGYGFEEIEQQVDGIYCQGCLTTHKRPTKMYEAKTLITPLCRYQIIRLYNPSSP